MQSQNKVSKLQKDDRFEGFLLVRSASNRVGSTGSPYLDMMLADNSCDINAKVWNTAETAPESGSVIKLRAGVTEFNGRLQLRVEKFRLVTEEDEVDLSLLVPCAPEKPEVMLKQVYDTIETMQNDVLKKIVHSIIKQHEDKLIYYPAAQSLHHAERSGLLNHITSMLNVAKSIVPCYPFLDEDLLYAGVILHDIAKILELKADNFGNVSDYTKDGLLLGHLVRGVSLIRDTARQLNIPEDDEYTLLLEHMILSHHGIAEYGSTRPPMFPEAEMLHLIDVMDARMNEMQGVLERTPRGIFSERIWSLDRRIYHPNYTEK